MPEDTQKVFISHASEDKERFVIQFAKRLRSQGIDAWVDIWEMLPGDSLVDKIFNDPDIDIRRTILRYIHKKPSPDFYELFDSKAIEKLMRDPEEEVVVAATRLACDLAEHGKIPRKILTTVNKYSYWRVRRIAIDCIVKADDPETLELLYEFRTTSYHVSQQLIRDYIEQHYGKFDDRQKQLAIDLVENLIQAKRASQISKSKNLKLLERLRNSDK